MLWDGRCSSPPSHAGGVGVSLYLGAILEAGVDVTAQALPSLFVAFCVHCASVVCLRVNCASVADCVAPRVLGFF